MNDLELYMDIIVTQGQDRKPKYLEFNDMELKHRIGIFALCTYSTSYLIWSSLICIIKYQVKKKY